MLNLNVIIFLSAKNLLGSNIFKKKLDNKKKCLPLQSQSKRGGIGEVAEWSIAAVLKTVELRGSGGSNPSLSAINAENQQIAKQTPSFTPKNVKLGVFVFFLR